MPDKPHPLAARPRGIGGALLLLLAVSVWSYWTTLADLIELWEREPDYSHGYLVVPLFCFFLYLRRDRFPAELTPSWSGVIVLLLSVALRMVGGWYFLTPLDLSLIHI